MRPRTGWAILVACALCLAPPALAEDSSEPPCDGDGGQTSNQTANGTSPDEAPCSSEGDGSAEETTATRPCYVYKFVSYKPNPFSTDPLLGMIVLDPHNCYTTQIPIQTTEPPI